MLDHILIIINGAIFVLAIIAGIGPQNLNIISHGIKRNHEKYVATTSFFGDITLILIGSIGLSIFSRKLIMAINIIGLIFMFWFLWTKIKSILAKRENIHINTEVLTKNQAIVRALALTWLNPLVFVDTIVIIGGAATRYSGLTHIDFIIGAIIADFAWIFGVTYLARTFSHKLNRKSVWLALDILTVILMTYICYKTILFIVKV